MKRSRALVITIYVLQFIGMLVFASELRAQITQIQANIVVPDISGAGTDASIFLGIGGREFSLDRRGRDDFERNSENTLIFGEDSNVTRPGDNDPRTDPPFTEGDIDGFPVYIRMSDVGDQQDPFDFPEDEWIVDFILVTVFSGGGVIRELISPRLGKSDDGTIQRLGPQPGHVLYLKVRP
jgi:hypothetical protein